MPGGGEKVTFRVRPALGLLLGCGLFVFLAARHGGARFVGYYNDDAYNIMAAKALTEGHYRALNDPARGPIRSLLPGYPLFLAPFVTAVAPRWDRLSVLSLAVFGCSILLLWRLLTGWVTPAVRLAVTVLWAAHPYPWITSGAVMVDPFFLVVVLGVFLTMKRALAAGPGRPAASVALFLLSVYAVATRPHGVLVWGVLGLVAVVAPRRAWLKAWIVISAIGLGVLGLGFLKHSPAAGHASMFAESLARLGAGGGATGFQIRNFLGTLAVACVWPGLDVRSSPGFLSWALAAPVMVLAGVGVRRRLSQGPAVDRVLAFALSVFIIGVCLLQGLWAAVDFRYFLPVLPFVLFFVSEGVAALPGRWRKAVGTAGVAIALGGTARAHFRWLAQDASAPAYRLPRETHAWVRQGADEPYYCLGGEHQFWLYTGRRALPVPGGAWDADALRATMARAGIRRVFIRGLGGKLAFRGDASYDRFLESFQGLLESSPALFERVYTHFEERTLVYQARVPPGYLNRYRLYESAVAEAQRGETAVARERVTSLLRDDPDFPAAGRLLGVLFLMDGRDAAAAGRALRNARALAPRSVPTLLTLARWCRRTGDAGSARELLTEAERWTETDVFAAPLRDAVRAERAELDRTEN